MIEIEAGRGLALSIIASRIERTAPREPWASGRLIDNAATLRWTIKQVA